MFYYFFGWEMRHLHTGGSCPVVSGQGCVIMTSFLSLAGRVAQSEEAMPNFLFCYVTSRKNQLFCAPILYRYIIIKLYNNTTIFSRLLPICVCFRGFAPDPAGGAYSPPPTPSWERLCIPKKVSLIFFSPMTCLNVTMSMILILRWLDV